MSIFIVKKFIKPLLIDYVNGYSFKTSIMKMFIKKSGLSKQDFIVLLFEEAKIKKIQIKKDDEYLLLKNLCSDEEKKIIMEIIYPKTNEEILADIHNYNPKFKFTKNKSLLQIRDEINQKDKINNFVFLLEITLALFAYILIWICEFFKLNEEYKKQIKIKLKKTIYKLRGNTKLQIKLYQNGKNMQPLMENCFLLSTLIK